MQTMNYNIVRQNGTVAELNRCRQSASQGLPPLPRRKHRCPLGVHMSDLLSMSMVAMTIIATGMIVAGL